MGRNKVRRIYEDRPTVSIQRKLFPNGVRKKDRKVLDNKKCAAADHVELEIARR